jgi:hypothetical protein
LGHFYSHDLKDEPLPAESLTDYRYLLEILMKKREDERDRLDRIETKIAVVVAGPVAALGFSLEKSGSQLDTFAAALFLMPLAILLCALLPLMYAEAPDAAEFYQKFPRYPLQSLKAAYEAIAKLQEKNEPKLEQKVKGLRWGINSLLVVAFIIVGLRCAETFSANKEGIYGRPGTGSSGAAASPAATSSAHARFNDNVRRKGG